MDQTLRIRSSSQCLAAALRLAAVPCAAWLCLAAVSVAHAQGLPLPGYKTLWPQDAGETGPALRVILPQPPRLVETAHVPASVRAAPLSTTTANAAPAAPTSRASASISVSARALQHLDPQLLGWVHQASERFELPSALLLAVIHAESYFQSAAVSPKNAVGLMQVLPGTAQDMGLKPSAGQSVAGLLKQPQINVVVGSRYLAEQWDRFGRLDLALAAYNAGPGAVLKAGRQIPNYPETQAYVRRVLALYQRYDRALLAAAPARDREPA